MFIEITQPKIKSQDQLDLFIKLNIRKAKALLPFGYDRVVETMLHVDELSRKWTNPRWTLDTVMKYIYDSALTSDHSEPEHRQTSSSNNLPELPKRQTPKTPPSSSIPTGMLAKPIPISQRTNNVKPNPENRAAAKIKKAIDRPPYDFDKKLQEMLHQAPDYCRDYVAHLMGKHRDIITNDAQLNHVLKQYVETLENMSARDRQRVMGSWGNGRLATRFFQSDNGSENSELIDDRVNPCGCR